MQAAERCSKAPSAIRVDLSAIFVSLELSRSKWLITSLSPGSGERMSKFIVTGGDVPALLGCLDGIFPRKFIVFHEDADELSDDKSWVCVIDLQTHLVAEIGEIFVIAQMSSEDVLQ